MSESDVIIPELSEQTGTASEFTEADPDDERHANLCEKCCTVVKDTFLTSFLLLILNVIYMTLGGLLFQKLEAESANEDAIAKENFNEEFRKLTPYFIEQFNTYKSEADDSPRRPKINRENLQKLDTFKIHLVEAITEHSWNYNPNLAKAANNVDKEDNQLWTLGVSMLFCLTVVTTIGYGNLVPTTVLSRGITCVYALIGIPLMLLFLNHLGDNLGQGFEWFFYHATCMGRRQRRRMCRRKNADKNQDIDDDIQVNGYKTVQEPGWGRSQKRLIIPVHISISIIGIYLCVGGIIFSEHGFGKWTFMDALYFSFVTLSTIGFGDFVFNTQDLDSGNRRNLNSLMCGVYIIFGLGLMSMCFDQMTNAIKDQMKTFGENVRYLKHLVFGKKNQKPPVAEPEEEEEDDEEIVVDTS